MKGNSESNDASLTTPTSTPTAPTSPAAKAPSLVGPAAAPQGSSVAAFFDVDNTIIRGASSFHLAKALYRRGFFGTRDIIAFAIKQGRYLLFGENDGDIADVRARALGLMKGHSVAEVIAIGEEVYDQVLANRIYEGTKRLLDQHLSAGHQVWLITATPSEAGELIARRLGATGALCTRVESVNGFYTGRLEGEMMHGQSKATSAVALAESHGIDLSESFAYGDSTNDIPLLNLVGNPCAINPDGRMRKHAQMVGWPTRDFRSKGRGVARRGITTASMTGGLWVAVLVIKRLLSRSK